MIKYKNIFYVLGCMLVVFSMFMQIPTLVDFCLNNNTYYCFFLSGLFSAFVGIIFLISNKSSTQFKLSYKDKLLIVVLSWFLFPLFGALPFLLSNFPISVIDIIFETTSAITTTGGSIIYDIKSLSDGFLIWRNILQLLGCEFFIVSCVCVFASMRNNYKFSYLFEVMDNSDAYNMYDYMKLLLLFHISVIFIGVFFLAGSGVCAVDAVHYVVSAITSGGIAKIEDSYINNVNLSRLLWILSFLMLLSGCSVNLLKNLKRYGLSAVYDSQFLTYISILLFSGIVVFLFIIFNNDVSFFYAIEKAIFLAISHCTTTGVSLCEDVSNTFINSFLYVIGFIGGCSGSSTGGIKIFRIMILFAILKNYILRIVNLNSVNIPTYAGNKIDIFDITSVLSFFVCYIILAIIFSLILVACNIEVGKAVSAVLTSMNNNGPFCGFDRAMPEQLMNLKFPAKITLILSMIAGRLEFVLIFAMFTRKFWKK